MSKTARTATERVVPIIEATTNAPTNRTTSQPASRPIRKARIDVDQATGSAPTRRIKQDSKPSKRVSPAASRDTKPTAARKAKPAEVHEVKVAVPREAKPAATPRGARKSSGGLSALDAAAHVLAALSKAESREGITAPDLIERMAKAKLWSSPGGKTPAATLYAAMIREITRKGTASRFTRIAPGRFAAVQAGKAKAAASARSNEPAPPASTVPSKKPAKSRAEVAA